MEERRMEIKGWWGLKEGEANNRKSVEEMMRMKERRMEEGKQVEGKKMGCHWSKVEKVPRAIQGEKWKGENNRMKRRNQKKNAEIWFSPMRKAPLPAEKNQSYDLKMQ